MRRATFAADLRAAYESPTWWESAGCAIATDDPTTSAVAWWWDADPTADEPRGYQLAAAEICRGCPVAAQCLDHADPKLDAYSVRGGQMPADWIADRQADAA